MSCDYTFGKPYVNEAGSYDWVIYCAKGWNAPIIEWLAIFMLSASLTFIILTYKQREINRK